MRAATLGSLALAALAPAASAWSQVERPEADVFRCAAGSTWACLRTSFRATETRARLDTTAPAWKVRFFRDSAGTVNARRVVLEGGPASRILVLTDISGSMKGLGIGATRTVLRDFLQSLDSLPAGTVRVAVAPFASVDVPGRIKRTPFVPPDSSIAQVTAMPDPSRENTGLFTAVVAGIEALDEETRKAGPGTIGWLVVITDGDNDTQRDPALLDGEAGLQEAARVIDRSPARILILGIELRLNDRALKTLAGPRGNRYLVGLDSYRMAGPLRDLRNSLITGWEATVPLSSTREELGRGWALATFRSADATAATAVWRPPTLALPAFAGTLESASGAPAPTRNAFVGLLGRRNPLVAFLVLVTVVLWWLVPRLLWPPLRAAVAAPAAAAPKKAAPPPGGIRTDVKEAPPRRPTDVTASRARRA